MDRKVPNPTQPNAMLIQRTAKLTNVKVQELVGSSKIALRTDSACESTGYGQEVVF